MIAEFVTILAMFIGGSALLRALGLRGWILPVFGFIAGVCIYVIFGTIQAITPVTSAPILTIILTLVAPLGYLAVMAKRGKDVRVDIRAPLIIVIALLAMVFVFREANMVNWHTDSIRYIMTSSLIAGDNYDSVSVNLVTKRLLSVPVLHAPAYLNGEWYLRSITPILAGSVLVTLAWLFLQGFKQRLSTKTIMIIAGAGLLLLASNNRFVFHSFYINGHLLFGALLLIIAGTSWLMVARKTNYHRVFIALQLLAIPALIVTRAEASLMIALALLPLLLSQSISYRYKATLLAVLGGSTLIWQAFIMSTYLENGVDLPFTVYGMVMVGVAFLAAIPLLRWRSLSDHARRILWVTEAGLWLAVVLLAIRNPELPPRTIHAISQNVVFGGGSWGASFVILASLVVLLLIFYRTPHQTYLRYPITTFLPLAIILAYLQGASYRVGDGDSLNRMWMQIIPLAILYIIVAVASGQWRFKKLDIEKMKQKILPSKRSKSTKV